MTFSAEILLIGVNPYVYVPEKVLLTLFAEFGKDKGPIPIKGTINGKNFVQTLVKYKGAYRLYVNGIMLNTTGPRVGDRATFSIRIDKTSRDIPINLEFAEALAKNKKAEEAFKKYSPSRQKEINRYLHSIKTHEILIKNIDRIIRYLSGEKVEYFVILRNKK